MKVLWITNILFPDVCKEIGISTPVIGGWMHSGAMALLNENTEINLAVASLYKGENLKTMYLNRITYYLVPNKAKNTKYNHKLEIHWKSIQDQFLPDIVHIHGTEYPHGLAYIRACGNKKVIVSIQGLVSVYEKYYYGAISKRKLYNNITLRDIVMQDTIFLQHSAMHLQGLLEKETIQAVEHIIGRTSWDKFHSLEINKNAQYHFCNETLRDSFYDQNWSLKTCKKYAIFLSQAHYPIKGLQQMIKALPLILRHYPDTKVYVAGNDFVTNRGWRLSGFGKYIRSLMNKYGVFEKIIFTGVLSEKEMRKKYLDSHIFVCPSSIENSPNSIGEAQLLGIPCVASYVGGVSDMVTDSETGLLFRFEEVEMLAKALCDIFSNNALAERLSINGKKAATLRHNKHFNSRNLFSIYKDVCKNY